MPKLLAGFFRDNWPPIRRRRIVDQVGTLSFILLPAPIAVLPRQLARRSEESVDVTFAVNSEADDFSAIIDPVGDQQIQRHIRLDQGIPISHFSAALQT